jgi:hypothetical protein
VTAPARLGSVLAMPQVLTARELTEFCRRCRCPRGEHLGRLGTNCPDGLGWSRSDTFEPSGDYQNEPVDVWSEVLP